MAQNTSQDTAEDIIDLVEIIQKGKVPPPKEDANIDFDRALSDLHGSSAPTLPDSPLLDDLLAGIDAPPASQASAPVADDDPFARVDFEPQAVPSLDDLLGELNLPGQTADATGTMPTGTHNAASAADEVATHGQPNAPEDELEEAPTLPEVPSFESLFADLGLPGDAAPARPVPAPERVAEPVAAPEPAPKAAAPKAAALATETIPGMEDVDALISKLDVPPSGAPRRSGGESPEAVALLDTLHSNDAPDDLDSLLDSLLTAGGPRAPQTKTAAGQPKEISEDDLDDLLSSIEVESGGKVAETPNAEPVLPVDVPQVAESADLADPFAAAVQAAQATLAEAPAKPAEPELELEAVLAPPSEAEDTPPPALSDDIEDLFSALDAEMTGKTSAPPVDDTALSEADLDELLAAVPEPVPTSVMETFEPSVAMTASPMEAEEDASAIPSAPADKGVPADKAAGPSLADVLAGKVELELSETSDDDPFAAFDIPEAVDEPAPDETPQVAEAESALAALPDLPEELTPELVLADVDALSASVAAAAVAASPVAAAPAAPALPLYSAADIERFDDLEQRLAMLEAELTLLQNRVDALETAVEPETLQDRLLDALSGDTPLRVQIIDMVQTAVQQSTAGKDKVARQQTELDSRVTALEERQGDAEWGREQGLSMLEKRFNDFEQRLDADSRLYALDERLVALENRPCGEVEKRLAALESRSATDELASRLALLENRPVASVPEGFEARLALVEQVIERLGGETAEERTRVLVEAMRADIERAAAESAARVLREEITALLGEQ